MAQMIDALTANEAASVTGVPLKQVHRIIDAGLLAGGVVTRKGSRVVLGNSLVGLRVAYLTADTLTLEARRRVVTRIIGQTDVAAVRDHAITVEVEPIASEVAAGLGSLAKAKTMVRIDQDILNGTPCIAGTRIPVHDIADMLMNGDSAAAIIDAYPHLTPEQLEMAVLYAQAYPRRGRPPRVKRHKAGPKMTRTLRLDDLPPAS